MFKIPTECCGELVLCGRSTERTLTDSLLIWEDAVANGTTEQVVGLGSTLVRLHSATPQEFTVMFTECELREQEIAVDLIVHGELNDLVDALLDLGDTKVSGLLFYSLCMRDGPASAIIRCIKQFEAIDDHESDWLLPSLGNHPEIEVLFPYIGHLGYELYEHCDCIDFQRLGPLLGGEDHFLAIAVGRHQPGPGYVAQIRALVASGINRDRAMGVAMDLHRHWILLSGDECRGLSTAYGVDYDAIFPLVTPRDLTPVQEFVWRLAHCQNIPEAIIDTVRPLAAIVEPLVPY